MSDRPKTKCFVPECSKSVGVLFPKNAAVKKKWLKALELEHLVPDEKSFICLDHFGENGQPGRRKKNKRTSKAIQKFGKEEKRADFSQLSTKKVSVISVDSEKPPPLRVSVDLKNPPPLRVYQQAKKAASSPPKVQQDQNDLNHCEDVVVFASSKQMCRLCMVQGSTVTHGVFSTFIQQNSVADVIGLCLHPLKVLTNDDLSKYICTDCLDFLRKSYKFRKTCLDMDTKQRLQSAKVKEMQNELRERISKDRKGEIDNAKKDPSPVKQGHSKNAKNDISPVKQEASERNYHSDADSEVSEYLHEERLSDYEGYEENKENEDSHKGSYSNEHMEKEGLELEKDDNGTGENSKLPKKRKYDESSEELLRVLEGNDTGMEEDPLNYSVSDRNDESCYDSMNDDHNTKQNEGEYAESIIIEMVNDEVSANETPLIDTSKLPITIKRVDPYDKTTAKRKRNNGSAFGNSSINVIQRDNSEEIYVLPEEMSGDTYLSEIGPIKSKIVNYVFDSEFVMADGYLYDYRLTRNDIRRLKCLAYECPGTANQFKLGPFEYAEHIEVIIPHNHEPPDEIERKKQMFYHILLFSKMRRDRNFNFKTSYEQFCQMDPSLPSILPLRDVIRVICNRGPAPTPPSMNSFEDFYELIENDEFHKIHFTENKVQFYQEKFETSDGGKAVVFANEETIHTYSESKLMFVDASFIIESEDFPFQLVTVLLWVHQSYYPIMYAFVNKKSQYLYREIFTFLYMTLAPHLRPYEIITEYEANLYYALGETYVESSIGGSMFYFTQNIYKKICLLHLAKELEINSNFRSIYNMLLMLPLLPVNTIADGLKTIENQARELAIENLTDELFAHVHDEWMNQVTPELFCVHRLENRINENMVAPFKKLRDYFTLAKNRGGKSKPKLTIVSAIEKVLDLEKYLRESTNKVTIKQFAKDISSSQKKLILKAWNFIENHPMININQFFMKVLGYIKCMENQLWIWGFYRYEGCTEDILIDANNFSIANQIQEETGDEPMNQFQLKDENNMISESSQQGDEENSEVIEEYYIEESGVVKKVNAVHRIPKQESEESSPTNEKTDEKENYTVLMEAVLDDSGSFVLRNKSHSADDSSDLVYQ